MALMRSMGSLRRVGLELGDDDLGEGQLLLALRQLLGETPDHEHGIDLDAVGVGAGHLGAFFGEGVEEGGSMRSASSDTAAHSIATDWYRSMPSRPEESVTTIWLGASCAMRPISWSPERAGMSGSTSSTSISLPSSSTTVLLRIPGPATALRL